MRSQIILNPWANKGQGATEKERILALAQQYGQVDVVTTTKVGEGERLARAAVDKGVDLIVAAGGDGTIHEVVNGLVQENKAQAALGIIPIGTGNDFAHALGVPMMLDVAVARAFTGERRLLDLAQIENGKGERQIVNNGIGIGFDATVAIMANRITRVQGFAAYLLATLRAIAFYYQKPTLELQFDGDVVTQRCLFLAIGVGPRIGGGYLLTPDAAFDDNLLDSCTVNEMGRLTMLQLMMPAMKGAHTTSTYVSMRQNERIVVKSLDLPLPVHVDGEIFAYHEDGVRYIEIQSLPAALSVIL